MSADLVTNAGVAARPADAEHSDLLAPTVLSRRSRRDGVWIVVALITFSAAVFCAGLWTPWPWSDEGATYLALLRDWNHLPALYAGPDAPMVPYYIVAKAWTTLIQGAWPSLSTLVATRLLSAAAATATAGLLYAFVARNAGRLAGGLAGVALVGLAGFDRYAQEARPYALLALTATASWLMWDRWSRPHVVPTFLGVVDAPTVAGHRWHRTAPAASYVLSLAVTAVIHTFGLFQWPAQALASMLVVPEQRAGRLRRVVLLAALMSAAAALAAAQVAASLMHGTGPPGPAGARVVGAWTILTQLARGMSATPQPAASAVVLALAAVGAMGCVRGDHVRFARTLLVWLIVPLALELALAAFRTNLFRLHYWIAFLPPIAALMALGAMTVASAVATTAQRWGGGTGPALAAKAEAPLIASVALAAICVQIPAGLPAQLAVRSATGHGEDLSGLLTLVAQARDEHPGVRVLIDNRSATGIIGAADPRLEAENPLRRLDPSSPVVYTRLTSTRSVQAEIGDAATLLWIYKGNVTKAGAPGRMPRSLASLHATVVWATATGSGWTVLLLTVPPTRRSSP